MNDPDRPTSPAEVLARLLGPSGAELSCEECFAQLDRYVELSIAQANPDQQVPGMRAHLEGCPACEEDFRSLRALLESHGGSTSR